MPTAPLRVCLQPRCPRFSVARGYCAAHRRSEAERGYGAAWRPVSQEQRRNEPQCRRCGNTEDLVADHVVNGDPSRLQTLCRRCNTAKRNAERRVSA